MLFLQFCTNVWVDFHTLGSMVLNGFVIHIVIDCMTSIVIFALLLALKTTPSFDENL